MTVFEWIEDCLVSLACSGQPWLAKGRRAEENHVSSTSSSCLTALAANPNFSLALRIASAELFAATQCSDESPSVTW